MSRTAILAVVLSWAGAGASVAQDNFTPPKPGAEHKELQKLAGTWDTVMDFAGQKSKGTATYKSICGGMWVQSDFQGEFGGQKFEGHGLDGYDLNKKKFVGVWVDSMSSTPMNMEGDFDEAKKQLVMKGEMPGPDGKMQKFKSVSEIKDDDHFTFKMYTGGEGQEQLAFTIEYTRKK
jgi:hypothetical protein